MKDCLKQNKWLALLTVSLGIIGSVAAVLLAKILQKVIDAAVDGDFAAFQRILLISIVYLLFLGLVNYLYSLSGKRLIRDLTQALRQKVFYGIFHRNILDFGNVNTADYLSAFTNDIKMIEENYLLPALLTLQYAVIFVVTLIMLLTISPLITFCLSGALLVMCLLPALMGKPLQLRQEALSKRLSIFTLRLKDFFLGYEVIKSFQLEERIKADFAAENTATADTKYRADKLFALNEGISGILAYLTQFSGLFIGAYLIIKGQITAGALVALIQLSGTFVSPVMVILENIPKIRSIRPVIKRLEEMAEMPSQAFHGEKEPSFDHCLATTNLSFAYEKEQPVLNNISITLQKNKKYAVVGKSGCGKTTLIKLLTGAYPEYSGEITYDGIELKELDVEKAARMVSLIHQNIYMFDDSIQQNICLYDQFTKEAMSDALNASGMTEFIQRLPNGILSLMGENGANLSGGQRQRVAVARALIRKKPVLILDEGTSAVDMQTAYDIESKLLHLDELTLITITHNLNEDLLRLYDQIIYMEDGAVGEVGSFDELLAAKAGFYHFFL